MIYLKEFKLLTDDAEWEFFRYRSQGCYDSFYPYQIFPRKRLETIIFSDITIFCGSNGSGKSTILNIIAEKLQLKRSAPYNKTDFFATYISGCNCEFYYADSKNMQKLLSASRIISSDDVFNHILDVRKRNYRLISKRKRHQMILQILRERVGQMIQEVSMPKTPRVSSHSSIIAKNYVGILQNISVTMQVLTRGHTPTARMVSSISLTSYNLTIYICSMNQRTHYRQRNNCNQ